MFKDRFKGLFFYSLFMLLNSLVQDLLFFMLNYSIRMNFVDFRFFFFFLPIAVVDCWLWFWAIVLMHWWLHLCFVTKESINSSTHLTCIPINFWKYFIYDSFPFVNRIKITIISIMMTKVLISIVSEIHTLLFSPNSPSPSHSPCINSVCLAGARWFCC